MNEIVAAISRVGDFRLHPFGFFYLVQSRENGLNRRVHVWTKRGVQTRANDRHQHSFDIQSTILLGRIRSEVFCFYEKPNGREREFEVRYDGKSSRVSATGRSGILKLVTSFESREGTSYCLRAGVIHRAVVIVRPCVTCLTTQERGFPTLSYGANTEETGSKRRNVSLTEKDEIAQVLELLK